MKKRLGFLVTLCIDVFVVCLSYFLIFLLRESPPVIKFFGPLAWDLNHAVLLLLLIVSFLLLALNQGLYNPRQISRLQEMDLLARMHGKWLILLMAVAYLWKYDFSRLILVLFIPLSFVLMMLGRLCARRIRNYLISKNIGLVTVVIIGRGKKSREVERELERYYGSHVKILSSIVPTFADGSYSIPHEELLKTISPHEYVQVYIAEPQLSYENILHAVSHCSLPHVEFKIVADIFNLVSGNFDISNIHEIPTLEIGKSQPALFYRITKRMLDIAGSIFLIIISAPLWILITISIKLETSGPIIISQKRVGHKGKTFTLYKFRTMHTDVPLYDQAPQDEHDKRITKVGRFLRKTSLDELPQLVNVLLGSMSLVGPRPEMPFIVERYTAWQRKRLEAKPGLTGLWQILGRKDIPLTENLHYDFYYINNQSLFLDVVILVRTVPVVLFGKGAY